MLWFTQKAKSKERPVERKKLSVKELTVFSMLGGIMFLSKFIMQALPNIHLLGLFICAFTLTYRVKALIPIYVFVFMEGAFAGFSLWWIPYLYIWTPLWGLVMLISKINLPSRIMPLTYMIASAIHGLSFGTLYAPLQALMFGLDFKGILAWIIAGLPFDISHCIGNFCAGILIFPLHKLMKNKRICS